MSYLLPPLCTLQGGIHGPRGIDIVAFVMAGLARLQLPHPELFLFLISAAACLVQCAHVRYRFCERRVGLRRLTVGEEKRVAFSS